MRLLSVCIAILLATRAWTEAAFQKFNEFVLTGHLDPDAQKSLQHRVTWDNKSLFVDGERIMIFSGEFHPFRLPVPSLWHDIFQKIKALGFNCVSFYVNWALLEGKPGEYTAKGIFALEPFFDAASQAGIYLLARPGPYINAEVSGGGFPGWLQRVNGTLRTRDASYLRSTDNYIANVARTIAGGQITNGGPVILYQPENEYSIACCGLDFPDSDYFQYVIDQAHSAGITVPLISNDAWPAGHNTPGSGRGSVEIYGHDSYPLGFNCANPTVWPEGSLPTDFRTLHLQQSPSTPYSLLEFQAGSFDPWGGSGFAKCAALVNHEFERIFYKNSFSFGVTIFNLYMTFGGTNWGNLGHPAGYTSYDYGSPISESRNITREKYSELKLEGNFAKVSSSYLTATPGNMTTAKYTDTSDLTVTPLKGDSLASYYIVRHANYTSLASTSYMLKVPSSAGDLVIPQIGEYYLSLHGRDSKIHVVDYDVAGTNILYSTAEVFTWKKFGDRKVLILYGGPNERHELAISFSGEARVLLKEGPELGFSMRHAEKHVVIGWDVSRSRRIVQVDGLMVILLDRSSAYSYWVPELTVCGISQSLPFPMSTASSIIVRGGYLVRAAFMRNRDLHISADFNATTTIEVIGVPPLAKNLYINNEKAEYLLNKHGFWTSEVHYAVPDLKLPNLRDLDWKYVDSLPEIHPEYDDSSWTTADHPSTHNTLRPLDTPTSLYSSDYGFHTGYLIYRGHFIAMGNETTVSLHMQGGTAFGSSVWLSMIYLGSFPGAGTISNFSSTYNLPKLIKGRSYVLTIVIDNMGLDENWIIGADGMKNPRGILKYDLSGRDSRAIAWKVTGNLGGEDYRDKVRGPLNEGGLYAERQGFHQPQPPNMHWKRASPLLGLSEPGIGFYSAEFDLDIPKGWDVPLYFNFENSTAPPAAYRVQLFINGYQYGKYTNNIGPQTSFPVPEGILNYRGRNWMALSLWALQDGGARLDNIELVSMTPVRTGMQEIEPVRQPRYKPRKAAY